MLEIVQFTVFAALVAAFIAWGSWVFETHRSASEPEVLSEVVVSVPEGGAAPSEARAIAIGFVGAIAEHKRDIHLINQAARTIKGEIRPLDLMTDAPPSLLKADAPPANIDLAVEFGGAKVDAKGVSALLHSTRKPGALNLAVVFDKPVADGTRTGVASASFPADNEYGFSLSVSGLPSSVANQIAMRFLQAHYAKRNPFFSGLDARDFTTFWRVRRETALIAFRSSFEAGAKDGALATEARGQLEALWPIVQRYKQWCDAQKLGGYLASVSGDASRALESMEAARACANGSDINEIDSQILRLRALVAPPSPSLTQATTAASGGSTEDQILAQRAVVDTRLGRLVDIARTEGRQVRINVILGATSKFLQFGSRLVNRTDVGSDKRSAMTEHSDSVLGLIAVLAPKASIQTFPAIDANGMTSQMGLVAMVNYAARGPKPADVLLIALGPLRGNDMLEALREVSSKTLIVLVAGNDGKQERLLAASQNNIVYVGALEGAHRAPYSNFGPDVDIFAPGSVTTYVSPTKVTNDHKGGSYAAAIITAAAANLISLSPAKLTGAEMKTKLLENAVTTDGERHFLFRGSSSNVKP